MRRFVLIAMLLASSAAHAREAAGPHWVGHHAAPGAVDDAATAERAARAFLAQHLRELAPGASMDDFVLAANVRERCETNRACKRTVSFWQTWSGMRVREGQLHVVIAGDAIFFAQSQAVPFVALSLGPEVTAARQGRVVVAVETARGYEVRVAEHRLRGTWDEWVGLDGRVLVRENRLRDATSTLVYDVPDRRPSMRVSLPASEADIVVDATAVTTGADGSFGFAGATASVVPGVVGPRVRVVDAGGAPASATLTANDGQPATWSLASDEFGDAQLSAFVHASIAKQKARVLSPGLAWLDQQLVVTINEPGGACNALSTGDDLHFYAGSSECENTARLADVVYHEFGHSFHMQSFIPGVGNYNLALSEGLADYFAASITGDPAIGRGFAFDDTPVRDMDPVGFEKVAPDDLVPSQHQSGLIIGGALWDVRRLLILEHGAVDGAARADRVFVGVVQRAPNISTSYMAALVGDDDDGDLGNGTPNQCAIEYAFARHGLAPDVQITRFGPLRVDNTALELPILRPAMPSCGDREVTGATLLIDGTEMQMQLTPTGLRSPLPADAGVVRFAIEVELDDGSRLHFPNNVADPEYTAYVGPTRDIWCERFDADPAWIQQQVGSPSPWQVDVPQGLAGDPTTGFTGQLVLGTTLDGDGRYGSIAQTQITTPPIEAKNYREVHLQFRRWLTVEDASYDQATISVNGTTVWTNAASTGGVLTHWDREWRFVDHDVTSFAGEPITVTWTLASDASRALGGWNIDDVCLVGVDKAAVCGDDIVDEGEECDDTGASNCDTDCTLIPDDNCCSIGASPHGSALLALGVFAVVRRRRRR
ncbi:MAG: MYXO-CTERM sorting domain-containing protein [Kofleriaceae bacterium]